MKKRCSLVLVVSLLATMLLGVYPVSADEGMDVDITIVGNDSDVDVDVVGDNPNININGQNINEPTVIRMEDSGADRWARRQLRKSVLPWMEETQNRLSLTMDGLAKLIVVTDSRTGEVDEELSQLATETRENLQYYVERLDEQQWQLDANDVALREALKNHRETIKATQEWAVNDRKVTMDYLDYRIALADYNNQVVFWSLGGLLLVLALGLGIPLIILARKLRW